MLQLRNSENLFRQNDVCEYLGFLAWGDFVNAPIFTLVRFISRIGSANSTFSEKRVKSIFPQKLTIPWAYRDLFKA